MNRQAIQDAATLTRAALKRRMEQTPKYFFTYSPEEIEAQAKKDEQDIQQVLAEHQEEKAA